MSLPNIYTISGNGVTSLSSVEGTSQNKQSIKYERMFFIFAAENLAQQASSSCCSSTCCFGSTMQSLLSACKINIKSRSCLEKELAYKSGSKVIAQAFMSQQKVSCLVTTRRAQELKRDFFINWSEKTLSNLQLLNLSKICVEMFFETESFCTFYPSNDLQLDGSLVQECFYVEGGLKLEKKFMEELLIALPFDDGPNSEFILNNKDVLWGHFSWTLLNNYPPSFGKPKKLSLEDILKAFVITIQSLGGNFSPSKNFKKFVLENQGHKDFLVNAPKKYAENLLTFYQKNLQEEDSWWFTGDGFGIPRTKFSNTLTDRKKIFLFNNLKA